VRLALDARPGPARRLGPAEERLLIERAMAAHLAPNVSASRGHRWRLAAVAGVAILAVGGGAMASFLAFRRFFVVPASVIVGRAPAPRAPARRHAHAVVPAAAPVAPTAATSPTTEEPVAPVARMAPVDERAAPAVAPRPAPDDLAAANRLRERGAVRQAHAAYARQAARTPNSPAALTASLAAANLELERLGQPRQALARFERIVEVGSGGLAEEASLGIAECHRRLGDPTAEGEALRQFLARFPGSLWRARAEARLQHLRE
jgi:tetratricopeptide (TPR) repeat protein